MQIKTTPYPLPRFQNLIGKKAIPFCKDLMFIGFGIIAAAIGLESFLLPNRFIDGGVTGVSLLITEMTNIPLSVLILLANIPFLWLGFQVIGKQFAIKASISIFGLALVLALFNFPEVTHDKLLVAVFGGFFLGAGIGLSIRGGGVLDGTEVLAIFLSKKIGATVGDVIMLVNIVIFSAAAYLLSIEAALYSMLTYLSASKTLDFVIDGIEEYTGVTIISPHNEAIREEITEQLQRGVTIFKGRGGYGKQGTSKEIDILYTVITRLEINKLNNVIEQLDPEAFVVMQRLNDTKGGMVKKRVLV
jgi:uncharacterized membrane-anchored protein YitT (DUF2179 family)